MSNTDDRSPNGTYYRIRIREQLAAHWTSRFGGMSIAQDADGTTVLEGLVVDQAALYGLLARVQDLGLTLLDVMRSTPRRADTS
jgi:hypothetical protein